LTSTFWGNLRRVVDFQFTFFSCGEKNDDLTSTFLLGVEPGSPSYLIFSKVSFTLLQLGLMFIDTDGIVKEIA
jgi:hypothetical protein